MADKKVTELSAITNLSGDDLLLVVNDPSGTPTSNKVTVSRLFANVVPNVVHKGTVTARGNTTFSGTTMTVSANATYSGTLTVTGTLVESGVTQHNGVQIYGSNSIFNSKVTANGNLDVTGRLTFDDTIVISTNGKIHANNAVTNGTITDAMLATNIDKYMEKANTTLLVNDRMQVANVNSLVNDRLQVANAQVYLEVSNATAQFANSLNAILTGGTIADTISANNLTVSANAGFVLSGLYGDPSSNNTTTEGLSAGGIFYSNTHLYICVDENNIKRIPLEVFS